MRPHRDDIAAFIAEPIQGEGGDNHIRPEFFQALLEIVHDHDALRSPEYLKDTARATARGL